MKRYVIERDIPGVGSLNGERFFRSPFKRHTGMTPAEYRNRIAHMNFDRGELGSGRAVA
jgi:hypothetical protein